MVLRKALFSRSFSSRFALVSLCSSSRFALVSASIQPSWWLARSRSQSGVIKIRISFYN
jgi:hypothetical protein